MSGPTDRNESPMLGEPEDYWCYASDDGDEYVECSVCGAGAWGDAPADVEHYDTCALRTPSEGT